MRASVRLKTRHVKIQFGRLEMADRSWEEMSGSNLVFTSGRFGQTIGTYEYRPAAAQPGAAR